MLTLQRGPAALPALPRPRGPLSAWMLGRLAGMVVAPPPVVSDGGRFGDDEQLALYLSYETTYSDLPGVDPGMEWDPAVLTLRARLEARLLRHLRESLPVVPAGRPFDAIPDLIASDEGPSLSRFVEEQGTMDDVRRVLMHRSAYQLKEADPHTLAIPRLAGRAKQKLAAIQAGEYGADNPGHRMHADLFALTMRSVGLDPRPNAYLDVLPASALLISNLITMFGSHRRLRGALVGHLTVFEMTSVEPMGRYSRGLQRLGCSAEARRFYDVHVLADAEHEHMALDMAQFLADDEPALLPDILFGAQCALLAEEWFAMDLLPAVGRGSARSNAA